MLLDLDPVSKMKYLKPSQSHWRICFLPVHLSPGEQPIAKAKWGRFHQESPLPKADTNSCLPIPSGCQKWCLASRLFALESTNVPGQKMASNTKLTSLGLCPSLHPGLVIFHCLFSSPMPSNMCLRVYAAFLVVRGCPYYLDFLWKHKHTSSLKKDKVDFLNWKRVFL